ncbi:MAG: dihydroorotate dehydrogenase (quinone) [SAR202 cluster bacterium]|nr:dihydroorotate dehydrogenase (quinone) [SAR202 cluster bacterium]
MIYKNIIRPLLFSLNPEKAHKVYELFVEYLPFVFLPFRVKSSNNLAAQKLVSGINVDNRVGLAAGFDKNAKVFHSIASFGFGYIIVGTVTLLPKEGNAKPRFRRLSQYQALVNSMGFPNDGVDKVVQRLCSYRPKLRNTALVVSISGTTVHEISECLKMVEPFCDAIELNLSSPNTKGIKVFHQKENLRELLKELNELRSKPLWVKLPSYGTAQVNGVYGDDYQKSKQLVLNLAQFSVEFGVDALTVANSRSINDSQMATGFGGLSGKILIEDTITMIKDVRNHVGDLIPLNGCGGIFDASDAERVIKAGATTVQVYSGLIYEGPTVAKNISKSIG